MATQYSFNSDVNHASSNDQLIKRKETRGRKRKHPVVEPVPPPPNLKQIEFDNMFSCIKGKVPRTVYKDISNPSDLLIKASDYTHSGVENVDLVVLSQIAFFVFNAGCCSIGMSFERFFLLAPFLMAWHSRGAGFKTRKKSSIFECRLCCKADRKKGMFGCSFSGALRISFKAETVTFHTINPHQHEAREMISKMPPPFFHTKVREVCKNIPMVTPSSARHITKRKLPPSIINDWNFMNINLSFFRSICRNCSEVKEYRAKYKSTGNWEQDVTKMEQLISKNDGLLAKRFMMGENSAIIICNRELFRVMIMEKPLLMMDCTFKVCCYPDSKMVSVAFRDKFGCTKIACTAVGRPRDDESSNGVANFFSAIIALARDEFELTECGTFSRLRHFIIDESEEEAVTTFLNNLGGLSRNVEVLFCQWHMSHNFKVNIPNKKCYETLKQAMYTHDKEKCDQLIGQAIQLATTEKVKHYVEDQTRKREKWASCFRDDILLSQLSTLQRIESIHSRWKAPIFKGGYELGANAKPLVLAAQISYFFNAHDDTTDSSARTDSSKFSRNGFQDLDKLPKHLLDICWKEFCVAEDEFSRDGLGNYKNNHTMLSSSSGSQCLLSFEDVDMEGCCTYFAKWKLPCRHMFIAALRRGAPGFIDTKCFVDRFEASQMDTYEQDDLEEADMVPAEEQILDTDRATTIKRELINNMIEIERVCHQLGLQIQEREESTVDIPEIDYDFLIILKQVVKAAYGPYQRKLDGTARRAAILKGFGKLWALSAASERKWRERTEQSRAVAPALDSQVTVETISAGSQVEGDAIRLDPDDNEMSEIELNLQLETDAIQLD